jgi:hypothetical protein
MRTPEFHKPSGIPGVPEVLLWNSSAQVQRTVSPGRIVTEAGEKTNAPLGATVTSIVVAGASLAKKKSETLVAKSNINRSEKILIAASGLIARLTP